ncbi:MAG TPA: hypothetical protein VJI75_01335 [Candidatus Nanoarchaeia archaeon]|nr:hypothetical protein [Candidatus Nanoarchaeia archaeon]
MAPENMEKTLEERLRALAQSVLDYPEKKGEIQCVLSGLRLSKEEVIQAYVNYDLDIFAYKNEIYESLPMRAVLYLHNLLKGSWHQERQETVLEMIRKTVPKSIIDLGFGTPARYVKEFVIANETRLSLVDLYDSAFRFAEVLLSHWKPSWRDFISFRHLDMNTQGLIGESDCYIFQDSIEHVEGAEKYLSKTVGSARKDSRFILSLPIGPLVPVHTLSWETPEIAEEWLYKCGLRADQKKDVHVNPEVDLFAKQFKEEFYNIIFLCGKK